MILIVLLGVFIGVVMGLLGGGGSALGVPMLRYGFSMEAREAIAVSLLVVGIGSAIGTAVQARHGAVSWKTGLIFILAGVPGAVAGSWLAVFMPGELQLVFFSLLVLGSGVLMLRPDKHERAAADGAAGAETGPVGDPRFELMLVTGFGLGMMPGLFGVAGGFLMVPAFVYVAFLPVHRAVGTAMAVVAANSLAGAAGYMARIDLPWDFVTPFLISTCLATLVGASLSHRMPAKALRMTYAVLLSSVGGYTLIRETLRLLAVA